MLDSDFCLFSLVASHGIHPLIAFDLNRTLRKMAASIMFIFVVVAVVLRQTLKVFRNDDDAVAQLDGCNPSRI